MVNERERILEHLRGVESERAKRAADPSLAARVFAVKAYQHSRFEQTYTDMLSDPGRASAARFFLDELYGPRDYRARDAQFERVVPALVRLFPNEIVRTVEMLAELHALSEQLDSRMGAALSSPTLDDEAYARIWRTVGAPDLRERQIRLMINIGTALDRHTRSVVLRNTLRLMRRPATAAGLGELQAFLEAGFDSFRHLRGAPDFLATVAGRERSLATAHFARGDCSAPPLASRR